METIIDVKNTNFHPLLKDIENMFWFFFLSIRTLSDYEIRNLLRQKNTIQEAYLSFNEMLDKFDRTSNIHIKMNNDGSATSTANILDKMIFMGRAIAVLVYEYLLSSNYFSKVKDDTEFKFLKHIRNGAAHDNKFDFKYKNRWTIGKTKKIEWNGLIINRELQDKTVFNDFITLTGVFLLAKHFSDKLVLIDSQST